MNKKLDFNDLSREALNEMLEAVEFCISFRKKEHDQWADSKFPGCLGIPAAILLFSIADAIESYHRGNSELIVSVDGKKGTIKKTQHLYILNSKFYGDQRLTGDELNDLYEKYRSILTHNLGLPGSYFLVVDNANHKLFEEKQNPQGEKCKVLNLNVFLNLTRNAVDMFLPESKEIIKDSHVVKTDVAMKDLPLFGGIDTINQMYNSTSSDNYVSPSGTDYTIPPNNSNY